MDAGCPVYGIFHQQSLFQNNLENVSNCLRTENLKTKFKKLFKERSSVKHLTTFFLLTEEIKMQIFLKW